MESFLVSTGVVALAEIGDKTQLLAFVLCAKYRKPLPIVAGIFLATIANHALAGALGAWITSLVAPQTLQWVLGISFIAMALWTLVPDKLDENDIKLPAAGVMVATLRAHCTANACSAPSPGGCVDFRRARRGDARRARDAR